MVNKIRNLVLWLLVAIFVVLLVSIFGLNERLAIRHIPIPVLIGLAGSFFILGILQIVMAVKSRAAKLEKIFFIIAGASAAMIPLSAILHNVVYGLFFSGKNGDEAVFFILAVLVCPILFGISAIGSVICEICGTKCKDANVQ
ncbi:MAG: hypothetical protein A2Y12_15820 [Planctomycetes bacterium GWF2_42_9]|nr:MAG: hypothetical protein A2Y12_15820 [Planctomycetes bacterium GWF2_42_9]HAL45993.1 hypothetical protein [Phycisphaerales bacterium]